MSVSELNPVKRLTRDIATAAVTLSDQEARYLVDTYYQMQGERIRANNQVRALGEAAEPHSVVVFIAEQAKILEDQVKRALDKYSEAHVMGPWMRSVKGIGPVISAGLLAHIDIEQAPTAGHVWAFAGLDPTKRWDKGELRPWNARLKTLCWKLGESFVKVSGDEQAFYGQVYKQRKAYEVARNQAGELADQAAQKLETTRIGKTTAAYKHYSEGRLPPAHIHRRACRYAVKLFLAHLQEIWWEKATGEKPALPYPIAHMDHVHRIPSPH